MFQQKNLENREKNYPSRALLCRVEKSYPWGSHLTKDSASLIPGLNLTPLVRYIYSTWTLLMDCYILAHKIGVSIAFTHMRKFFLTYLYMYPYQPVTISNKISYILNDIMISRT